MDLSFAGGVSGNGEPIPTLTDFDTTNMEVGQRIGGKKDRQFVLFYNKTFQEFQVLCGEDGKPQLDKKGKPVRALVPVTKEVVKVVTPGDKNEHEDYATDYHRREFWPHYKAFREGRTAPLGMPIDQCEFVSSSVAIELMYLGVKTREQLADASDALCDRVPNGWELREYARAICQAESSQKNPEVLALRTQLEQQNAVIEQLKEQVGNMQGLVIPAEAPKRIKSVKVKEA